MGKKEFTDEAQTEGKPAGFDDEFSKLRLEMRFG